MSHALKKGIVTLIAMGWMIACAPRGEAPAPGAKPPARAVDGLPLSRISDEAYELVMKTLAYGDVGDFFVASEAARAAVRADPEAVYVHIAVANFAGNAQEFSNALTEAMRLVPQATAAERLIVRAQHASFIENNTAAGLEAAQVLTELYPDSPRAWLVLAGLQAAANDHEAARATAAKALAISHDHAGAHNFLAISYLFNEPKDFGKGEHHMAKLTEIRPEAANAWVGLGDAHRAMTKLYSARDDYTKALSIQPGHPLAAVKRGHVNSFLGSFEEARSDYDTSISTATGVNRAALANYRAFVHLHARQPERAIAELEELLAEVDSMDMSDGDKRAARLFALQNISNIAFYTDDTEVARDAVARMSQVFSEQAASVSDVAARGSKAAALYWQGKLAAHLGDFATAEELANEYLEVRKPDENPRKMENYHEILGIVSLRQKAYDAAVDHFGKSNLQFGDIFTKYHLAEALEGAGHVDRARVLFKEVADWSFNSVGFALLRAQASSRAGGG